MTVPSAPQTVEPPPTGQYRLDPTRSTITFGTKHMFGLGRVSGSFTLRTGTITVTDPVTGSTAVAEIAADSFTTGNNTRDRTVRSRTYLDVENHPTIRFTSQDLAETGDTWVLSGLLTVRETQRPVRLEIQHCHTEADTLTLTATTRVDRTEFGITAQRGMTGRYLDLVLNLEASAQPDSPGSS